MAVYTDVAADELAEFLAAYDIGELLSYKGIAEGVENSNFLLHTSAGYFILTLYEKRVAGRPAVLSRPDEHLAGRGITCPQPVKNKQDGVLWYAGRPAGRDHQLFSKASGRATQRRALRRRSARRWRKCISPVRDFKMTRANALSARAGARCSNRPSRAPTSVQPGLCAEIAAELDYLEGVWPRDLPQGVIHADLFPDNVFFLGGKLSRADRFLFRLHRYAGFDVAICLNAWCFESDHSFNVTKGARCSSRLWQ
jgi:homoserine kinase type II